MTFDEAYAMVKTSLGDILKKRYDYLNNKLETEVNFRAKGPTTNHVECHARVLSWQLEVLDTKVKDGSVSTVEQLAEFLSLMKKAKQEWAYGVRVGIHLLSQTVEHKEFDIGEDAINEIDELLNNIEHENGNQITFNLSS
jgi:hypothetical protein